MFSPQSLARLSVPASGVLFASVAISAKKDSDKEHPKVVRASELPLYSPEEQPTPSVRKIKIDESSQIYETISTMRKELWTVVNAARDFSEEAMHYVETAKAHSAGTIDFLREESNILPRIGAVGVSALAGYIFSLRKGLIGRVFYPTAFATGMGALCYPREVQEYTKELNDIAGKYLVVGYHFLNGVCRDLTGLQLPALPGSSTHLVISEGHHHHHDPPEAVPSSTQLLPPHLSATHIPMPHEEQEAKKLRDQSNPEDKDLYPKKE